MSTQPAEQIPLTESWDRFRAGRNSSLASQHGWLTLTSFQWLPASPAALDGVPGLWSTDGTAAFLTAAAPDHLTLVEGETPVDGTIEATLADEESLMWVQFGTVVVELGMRAGRYIVRTRDSQSPTLTGFTGVPVFGYNPGLVLTGAFERYAEPRTVAITTAHPDVPGAAVLVGDVVFELGDTTYRLGAVDGGPDSLVVTFHDETNNASSWRWRKLEVAKPGADGAVVVDFNRTVNYPAAFSDFGTCPAPVEGNRIKVAVEAGERDPRK